MESVESVESVGERACTNGLETDKTRTRRLQHERSLRYPRRPLKSNPCGTSRPRAAASRVWVIRDTEEPIPNTEQRTIVSPRREFDSSRAPRGSPRTDGGAGAGAVHYTRSAAPAGADIRIRAARAGVSVPCRDIRVVAPGSPPPSLSA
jgi:hypothetical protein